MGSNGELETVTRAIESADPDDFAMLTRLLERRGRAIADLQGDAVAVAAEAWRSGQRLAERLAVAKAKLREQRAFLHQSSVLARALAADSAPPPGGIDMRG
jgi:hypothetical protein